MLDAILYLPSSLFPKPMPASQKMTAADVAWLRMERPTNPMTITGVLTTDAPMPRETFLRLLRERLLVYPRFRMRVDDPASAAPRWVLEEPFDLDRHVIPFALPAPGDQAALQTAASDLMSTPLSFARAPWTMHHIERYGEGSAVLVRLHHCIGDGIALMHVLLALSDERWNPATAEPPARRPKRSLKARATVTAGKARDLFAHPTRLVGGAKAVGGGGKALAQLLLMRPDSDTLFKGDASPQKRAAWTQPIPLDGIKAVGRATGAKVNDVLLAAAAGALRRYLASCNEPTHGVEVRAAVPFNVRPLERAHELGNAFALVFVRLPVGVEDAGERLRLLKRRMDALKGSQEPAVVYGILQSIGRAPHWVHERVVKMFSEKCSAVMTNVSGPQETLHLLGVPLGALMFWVPQAGDIGLGLSILSYDGRVLVGVTADTSLVPDPGVLAESFEAEFAALCDRYAVVRGS